MKHNLPLSNSYDVTGLLEALAGDWIMCRQLADIGEWEKGTQAEGDILQMFVPSE